MHFPPRRPLEQDSALDIIAFGFDLVTFVLGIALLGVLLWL